MTPTEKLADALSQRRNPQRAIELLELPIQQHPETDAAEQARSHLFNLKHPEQAREADEFDLMEADPRLRRIVLTTTDSIPGYETTQVLEIITAECVLGLNLFADFLASVRDVVGGRSGALQQSLRLARRTCLHELRLEALAIDADGVLGVSLKYNEISGGGKSMLLVIASGTAVRVQNLI
jgi:uncharacterized protein YbjQ (UPF0145 family)